VTTFIIVAVLMVAAALAWVLWPLLRPANRKSIELRAANLTIFKDQFADLDSDLARGTLSREQYDEAKSELERRMLDESRADPTAPIAASARPIAVSELKNEADGVAASWCMTVRSVSLRCARLASGCCPRSRAWRWCRERANTPWRPSR